MTIIKNNFDIIKTIHIFVKSKYLLKIISYFDSFIIFLVIDLPLKLKFNK